MTIKNIKLPAMDTRLVRYGHSIYKYKLKYRSDTPGGAFLPCMPQVMHRELEAVMRALIPLIFHPDTDMDIPLHKIKTEHFLCNCHMVPWPIVKDVQFKRDGKLLQACPGMLVIEVQPRVHSEPDPESCKTPVRHPVDDGEASHISGVNFSSEARNVSNVLSAAKRSDLVCKTVSQQARHSARLKASPGGMKHQGPAETEDDSSKQAEQGEPPSHRRSSARVHQQKTKNSGREREISRAESDSSSLAHEASLVHDDQDELKVAARDHGLRSSKRSRNNGDCSKITREHISDKTGRQKASERLQRSGMEERKVNGGQTATKRTKTTLTSGDKSRNLRSKTVCQLESRSSGQHDTGEPSDLSDSNQDHKWQRKKSNKTGSVSEEKSHTMQNSAQKANTFISKNLENVTCEIQDELRNPGVETRGSQKPTTRATVSRINGDVSSTRVQNKEKKESEMNNKYGKRNTRGKRLISEGKKRDDFDPRKSKNLNLQCKNSSQSESSETDSDEDRYMERHEHKKVVPVSGRHGKSSRTIRDSARKCLDKFKELIADSSSSDSESESSSENESDEEFAEPELLKTGTPQSKARVMESSSKHVESISDLNTKDTTDTANSLSNSVSFSAKRKAELSGGGALTTRQTRSVRVVLKRNPIHSRKTASSTSLEEPAAKKVCRQQRLRGTNSAENVIHGKNTNERMRSVSFSRNASSIQTRSGSDRSVRRNILTSLSDCSGSGENTGSRQKPLAYRRDRSLIQLEEIEEEMNLQQMAQPHTSPRKDASKRRRSSVRGMLDLIITPFKNMLYGTQS